MKGGTRKRGKTWSYYFDAAQIGGKRKKIEKGGFRTKKEAEAALAKALAEYDNSGQVFEPSTISVSDYLDFWMEQYCLTNLSNATQQTYSYLIKNHLRPKFGAYRLKDLKAAAIQKYVNELKADGYSKSTISSILIILSSSMKYAVEPMHYIKENPCQHVKIGKVAKPARNREVIADDVFEHIIDLFPAGSRYYLPLMIGWNCGLRINECVGLTWNDIDFEQMTLTVDKQLIRYVDNGTSCMTFAPPKYDSKRTISFGATLCQIFKAEKRRQTENELMYGEFYRVYQKENFTDQKKQPRIKVLLVSKGECPADQRCHFICLDENGSLVTKTVFTKCTATVRKELGLNFDYHSLRHTHTTKLVEAGVNIKAIQQRMGHKNISTTLNTYAHATATMEQEAAELFERAVNGLPPK